MTVKRKVKVQEGELLDDDHIERVIEHLDNGGKKVEAYGILNIKANPTRLARIIEEYHERKAITEKLRKANRGKPASTSEIQHIIKGALEGEGISVIAEELYRSMDFVKRVIEGVGIPRKLPGSWYERRMESSIPDKCISERFPLNEIVWSDKYNGLAIARGETLKNDGRYSYEIYVIEKMEEDPPWALNGIVYRDYGGFFANQYAEELGSLSHLKEYGIDLAAPYREVFKQWLK